LLLLFVGLFLPYIFGQKNDLERSYELFYQIEVKKESGIRVLSLPDQLVLLAGQIKVR